MKKKHVYRLFNICCLFLFSLIDIAYAVAPANDDFINAEELFTSEGTVSGTTIDATSEAGEPNHAGWLPLWASPSYSVWYKWTALASVPMQFKAIGGENCEMAVYTGSSVDNLTFAESISSRSSSSQEDYAFVNATAGVTYFIAIDGPNRSDISLNYSPCETITVSGIISLPGSDVAPSGGLIVGLRFISQSNDSSIRYFDSAVLIAEGEGSLAYNIILPKLVSTAWIIDICTFLQSHYIFTSYYSDSGATWDKSAATLLSGGVDHIGKDFTLIEGNTISGTISLPGSAFAPSDGMRISVWADADNYSSSYYTYMIAEGENSIEYTLHISPDPSRTWTISYYNHGDEPYFYRGYYSDSGTTVNESAATLLTGNTNYNHIDLNLLPKGGDINGDSKISLADIILGLRIMSGNTTDNINLITGDSNDDQKIGFEEVLYNLTKISN